MDVPDSVESVALSLFQLLLTLEREGGRNEATASWALGLFRQCLDAVKGDPGKGSPRH